MHPIFTDDQSKEPPVSSYGFVGNEDCSIYNTQHHDGVVTASEDLGILSYSRNQGCNVEETLLTTSIVQPTTVSNEDQPFQGGVWRERGRT